MEIWGRRGAFSKHAFQRGSKTNSEAIQRHHLWHSWHVNQDNCSFVTKETIKSSIKTNQWTQSIIAYEPKQKNTMAGSLQNKIELSCFTCTDCKTFPRLFWRKIISSLNTFWNEVHYLVENAQLTSFSTQYKGWARITLQGANLESLSSLFTTFAIPI